MELFERIRRDHREEAMSVRALAKRHQVHRRAVRQALSSAVPPARKTPERPCPVLGPHKATIRSWLEADQDAPKKQRHTARRIWQRLLIEHGARIGESTVRAYVAEIRRELASGTRVVTIAQTHAPGAEAEVDFGELTAQVSGVDTKLWMFVMRLSSSGRAFHMAFATQAQEAFFEGHALALHHFGGVPGRIRFDNLRPAVSRILIGRDRVENERFVALRSHYGFDSFFCVPGVAGAHEKGGVEGEIGRFRRNHLTPVPRVGSLSELNAAVGAADLADDDRIITGQAMTVGEAFARERVALAGLPHEPFDTATLISCRVDAKARICVRQSHYSVPTHLARSSVTVRLGSDRLEVLAKGRVIAQHERAVHRGSVTLLLDHYLEVLARRPGAMAGSVALDQARARGVFTSEHERFWAEARRQRGDEAGTHALIEVLLLQRTMPSVAIRAGITAALSIPSVDPQVVALEARRGARGDGPPPVPVGALVRFDRPAPRLEGYDELLAIGAGR